MTIWDDHEVEDNYAGDEADSKQTNPRLENSGYPRRVPFERRRRNGYKAYFEAHPRLQQKGMEENQIYGSIRLGGLAELFLTDQRQYRDPQPCSDGILVPCEDAEAPGRTFLGDEQKKWFKKAVPASSAHWKLWASELMVMSVDAPAPVRRRSSTPGTATRPSAARSSRSGRTKGLENLVVLTGDIHTFIAGDLTTTGRVRAATRSASSWSAARRRRSACPSTSGVPSSVLDALRVANDPHIKYADFDRRGYAVLDITKNKIKAEFKSVDALTKGAPAQSLARFEIESGDPTLHQLT